MIIQPQEEFSKLAQFRDERLRAINTRKMPLTMPDGAKMALLLLPVPVFESSHQTKVELTQHAKEHLFRRQHNFSLLKHNTHRYLFGDAAIQPERGMKFRQYAQLFRQGVLEAVFVYPLVEGNERHEIHATRIGQDAIQCLKDMMEACALLRLQGPYVLNLTLLRIHNYRLELQPRQQRGRQSAVFDRDCLFLPEVRLEQIDMDAERILRPMLDMIWYTFYGEACLDYKKDGRWAGWESQEISSG